LRAASGTGSALPIALFSPSVFPPARRHPEQREGSLCSLGVRPSSPPYSGTNCFFLARAVGSAPRLFLAHRWRYIGLGRAATGGLPVDRLVSRPLDPFSVPAARATASSLRV